MDNRVGIYYGSGVRAGWRGAKREINGTTVKQT